MKNENLNGSNNQDKNNADIVFKITGEITQFILDDKKLFNLKNDIELMFAEEEKEEKMIEIEQTIFISFLKKIRSFFNLTQKDIAKLTGKKTITIQAYENKRLKISLELLFLILRKLNINQDTFRTKFLYDYTIVLIPYFFFKEQTSNDFLTDEKIEEITSKYLFNIFYNLYLKEVIQEQNNYNFNIENLKTELLNYLNFKDEFLKIETTEEEKKNKIEKILSFIDFLYFQDIIKK